LKPPSHKVSFFWWICSHLDGFIKQPTCRDETRHVRCSHTVSYILTSSNILRLSKVSPP
jgi:hypothetical protein